MLGLKRRSPKKSPPKKTKYGRKPKQQRPVKRKLDVENVSTEIEVKNKKKRKWIIENGTEDDMGSLTGGVQNLTVNDDGIDNGKQNLQSVEIHNNDGKSGEETVIENGNGIENINGEEEEKKNDKTFGENVDGDSVENGKKQEPVMLENVDGENERKDK